MTIERMRFNWEPPGPVAAAFMRSTAMVQIINGPIGSGKTTAGLLKHIRTAVCQQPSPTARALNARGELVPVRFYKLSVVRDTYRQLWKTTIPTWWDRVPKDAGEWTGAENAPAAHRISWEINRGTINSSVVDFIVEWGAIGENMVEDFMRGYEPTAFHLEEIDLLVSAVLQYAQDRAGRYPKLPSGAPYPTWRGVTATCNAPVFESWLYSGTEIDPDTGQLKPGIFTMTPAERRQMSVDLFIQPGGREPNAENVKNLPANYYAPKVGQTRMYIARMIDNKPGWSEAGKPVHPEFNQLRHVAGRELEPIPGMPVIIGLDPRTHPSAAFMQRLANGQRRFIDELQGEQNMGARRFGRALAQLLHDRYPFLRPTQVRGIVDPSATYGADKQDDDKDWSQIVSAITGIRIDAASSNNPHKRREALKTPLTSPDLEGGQPAILISPHCKLLATGLASGFRYRKMQVPGATRYSEDVEKNHYADICEAAEYACLGDGVELEILERKEQWRADVADARRTAVIDWDPLGMETR